MSKSGVDLESLLEQKFETWEQARREVTAGEQVVSADMILEDFLKMQGENWVQFVSGSGAVNSIQSFRWAYDNAVGWREYECALSELDEAEIQSIQFGELVYGLPP